MFIFLSLLLLLLLLDSPDNTIQGSISSILETLLLDNTQLSVLSIEFCGIFFLERIIRSLIRNYDNHVSPAPNFNIV